MTMKMEKGKAVTGQNIEYPSQVTIGTEVETSLFCYKKLFEAIFLK